MIARYNRKYGFKIDQDRRFWIEKDLCRDFANHSPQSIFLKNLRLRYVIYAIVTQILGSCCSVNLCDNCQFISELWLSSLKSSQLFFMELWEAILSYSCIATFLATSQTSKFLVINSRKSLIAPDLVKYLSFAASESNYFHFTRIVIL